MFWPTLVRTIAINLLASWRGLVAADLIYKLLAFILLTPLFVLLFRCLLMIAGQGVLSDVDIAMFFAGPFGWFCAIALGSVWLAIIALEQASLLSILAAQATGKGGGMLSSLRFSAGHAVHVLAVTARVIGWSLLVIAPFLLLAGGVYLWLLGEYDINYYLNKRPTEFRVAVAVGVSLVLILCGILFRLYSGWFLALPLVLFDQVPPSTALRESSRLVSGHRRQILFWLVTWLLTVVVVNVVITAIMGGAGRLLIPSSIGSLPILATRVGLLLLVLAAAGVIINLFATVGFSGLLFHGYQRINPNAVEAISAAPLAERSHGDLGRFITRGRLLSIGVISSLAAAIIGYASLNTVRLEDDVEIMAHRGASAAAPENTMAAFRQAIADGADWIELDVQETADGEVVVMHDSDFMKLSDNPLKIWDAKLEDLSGIDIGSWFDPEFADERAPTLAEVLRLCNGKIGVNIELKYYGHDQQLEQRVVDIVEAEGMASQIMVMSLKPEGVAKIKALRPNWKCGLLLSVSVGSLKQIPADFLAVNAQFATRNFVRRAHNADKQVFVWTVNDAATMCQMLNRNVDGILTDRPDLGRQVLQQRSEMSTSERLLAEISTYFNQTPVTTEQ